jgi:hypothetical protein
MGDSGYDLGVDLYELWHAGQTLVPQMSGEFFLATSGMIPGNVSYAFQRGSGIGIGPTGPFPAWQSLCLSLNDAVEHTAQNLADVGVALRLAADTFAKTDDAAATEFHKRQKELG